MCADGDIFVHSEASERLHDLEGARDASPCQKVRRHARNVRSPVKNTALARGQKAADDGEQRGLAGAIWADQCGDPADFDGE